jgi:NAD(P)H dehydrogenase (quinone)
MTDQPTLFVSGAGGKLGRRVVELLLERGYSGRIVAGSRHPEKLAFPGVETRQADFNDVPGLTAALDGVDHMLLISTDVLGPGRAALHANAVAAAKAAGVRHIVYTSMLNPEPGSPITFAPEHHATEEAIRDSGIAYTVLRMSWYAENLLNALPPVLQSGKWYSAAGEGRLAHIAREDCARAAAGALIAGGESRTLDVTGEKALTAHEIAAVASAVTGKPLEVVDVGDEALAAGARQAGVPDAVIDTYIVPFEINTRAGRMEPATDAVEQLWGSKPQSVRAFLEANKAALL